jgi:hypothetical protein
MIRQNEVTDSNFWREDHSEGAQAAAEEANKQGMRIIIGLGTEKEELFL